MTIKEAEKLIYEDKAKFVEEIHIQDDMFEQIYTYENFRIILPVHGNERYSIPELIEVEEVSEIVTKIDLVDKYRDLVLNRTKVQTIRKGRRDYPLNKAVLSFENESDINIIITEVTYKRFKYVTEEEAIADGFNSKSELFKALQEFYPDINSENEITLVKFKLQ